jgi:hypothetical protein
LSKRRRPLATTSGDGNYREVLRRILAAALITFASTALAACSLFHHEESPQQQFMSALQHGNGPQMNQIWLNMSPEDRANMAHSQGFKPTTSPDEVKTKLQQAITARSGDADGGTPTFAPADGTEQQTEIPTVNTGGGIENLPGLSADSAPAR